jgi:NADH dehydrogenase FAD-containing subunit
MKFNYKTKGMMADIGKRSGVAIINVIKLHVIIAWWTSHQFFKRDVAMIKRFIKDTPKSSVSKSSINQDKVISRI